MEFQPYKKTVLQTALQPAPAAAARSMQFIKDNRDRSVTQRQQVKAMVKTGSTVPVIQKMDKRPSFTADAKKSAIFWHNTQEDTPFTIDEDTPDLPGHNAAMPHRFSWKDIRDNTNKFHKGKEEKEDFERWTGRFDKAGKERIKQIKAKIKQSESIIGDDDASDSEKRTAKQKLKLQKKLLQRAQSSQESFVESRDEYADSETAEDKKEFLRQANSFHANVPDFGPHKGVNNPVREAGHLHFVEKKDKRGRSARRSPSPMSRGLLDMSPERLSTGLAFDDDDNIITTTGSAYSLTDLPDDVQESIEKFPKKVIRSYDADAPFGNDPGTSLKKRKKRDSSKKQAKKKRRVDSQGNSKKTK